VCGVLCLGPELVCDVSDVYLCVVVCVWDRNWCVLCLGRELVCGVVSDAYLCVVCCVWDRNWCVVCCVWDRNYCTLRPQPYSSQCINAVTPCCQHDVAGHNVSLRIPDNLADSYPSTVGSMAPVCIHTPAPSTSPRNGSREVATLTVVPIFGINLDR